MYRVSIDIDLDAIQQQMVGALFPAIAQAVAAVAEHGANEWKAAVHKAPLWSVEKAAYIDSIQWRMTGQTSAEIWADYKLSGEIESGRPARDLKKYLQTSRKVRTTKKGQRYLIIPFRHNTPGNSAHAAPMPDHVYDLARQLSKSSVNGMGKRLSGSGHLVPQASYKWGGRLPPGLMPKAKPHHKTDLYAGMVKFDSSANGKKSSVYLTFRVMSENSSGWIVPAKPGLNLAQKVSQNLQPLLEAAVSKAVSLSI